MNMFMKLFFWILMIEICGTVGIFKVREVKNQEEFNSILDSAGDKLVLVDFYAKYDRPSVVLTTYFEQLSLMYRQILFLKVDILENQETADSVEITGLPTFIFYKKKKIVDEKYHATPMKLRAFIEQTLKLS